jgi:hypothetical protein
MIDQIQYQRTPYGIWTATLRDEAGRKWSVQGAGKTIQEAENIMWEQYRKLFNTQK